MSKFLSFALLVIVLINMAACSLTNPPSSTAVPPSTITTAPDASVSTTAPTVTTDSKIVRIITMDGPLDAALTRVKTTVAESPLEYGWACYDGRIFVRQYAGAYDIDTVYGSERYISVFTGSMAGAYRYLVDVQTGTVSDPLAALDAQIREHMTDIVFSADGKYALVLSHGSTAATLLDCAAGQNVSLPVKENIYSVFGSFIDNSHILLTFCHQNTNGEFFYTFTRYNIATGESNPISGEYQKTDSGSNFIGFCDGGILYTFVNGQLAIIDPLTWEKTIYPFGNDVMLSYYTHNTYIARTDGKQYLLHQEGTYKLID